MYPFRSHTLKSTLLKPELEMSRKSQSMKYSSPKVAPSNFGEQLEEKTSIPKKSTKEENYFKSIIRSNEYVDLRLKQKIQEYQNVSNIQLFQYVQEFHQVLIHMLYFHCHHL